MKAVTSCALSFTRAAKTYQAASEVQQRIVSKLAEFLPDECNPQRILELGCGTGSLTTLLRQRYPKAWIDGVDVSAGMVEQAAELFRADTRTVIHHADARKYESPELYDLVSSSSAMHWMKPLESLFDKLRKELSDRGFLCFSLMLDGTLTELHTSRNRVASHKSFGLELPKADNVVRYLRDAGFEICSFDTCDFVCIFESMGDLLKNLHELGVNSFPRSKAPLSRGELVMLETVYRQEFMTTEGQLPATFSAGFVKARCKL